MTYIQRRRSGRMVDLLEARILFAAGATEPLLDHAGSFVAAQMNAPLDVNVGDGLAELAFADTSFAAGTYFVGDSIAGSLTPTLVAGDVTAYDVLVSVSVDAVAGNNDDIALLRTTVTTGSTVISSVGPIPAQTPIGDYFLVAQIDPDNLINETNKTNNVLVSRVASIRVALPPGAKPTRSIGGTDPSFGSEGVIRDALGLSSSVGAREQPGGTIIIAGSSGMPGSRDVGLARRLATGAADLSWGSGGRVTLDLRGTDDMVADFRVLDDGRILVAGTSGEVVGSTVVGRDFFVTRFNADGTVDASFGQQGTRFINFAGIGAPQASFDMARSMLLLPDGSILLVGRTDIGGNLDIALAQLTPDGAFDLSFGIGGRVRTDIGGGDDGGHSAVLHDGDGFLVAGFTSEGPARQFAVARYDFAGMLDRSFGRQGFIKTPPSGPERRANAITVDDKQRIIIAGSSASGAIADGDFDSNLVVARFDRRGRPDQNFGDAGIARIDVDDPAVANSVRVQPGGQITISGVSSSTVAQGVIGDPDIVSARLNDRGTLDTAFGDNGIVKLPIGGSGPSALNAGVGPLAASQAPLALPDDVENTFQELEGGTIIENSGGGAYTVGTDGPDTVITALILSGVELSASIISTVPTEVIGGKNGSLKVEVANVGDTLADGAVDMVFYTSADQELDSGDREFYAISGQTATIKALTDGGKAKKFKAKFQYPTDILDGQYYLLATINASTGIDELNPNNNEASSANTVQITAPVIDLAGTDLTSAVAFRDAVKPTKVSILLTNKGTIKLQETAEVNVIFSADEFLDSDDISVPVTAKINLKPLANGQQTDKAVKLSVTPTGIAAGSYFLFIVLDPSNALAEKNEENNLLSSTLPATVP